MLPIQCSHQIYSSPYCYITLFSIIIETAMDKDKEDDQFGIEAVAYDQLERQFQDVLSSLYADQSLDRFRVEYQKIHKALKTSHEQEKRLLSKCRELSRDILAGATRVQQALRFSNDDSQTISYLKSELTKTYKLLELSREHEETSKQNIEKRKLEMKRLQTILEQNQTLTEGQVATVHEYMATNQELAKEKEILQVSVQSNTVELHGVNNKINEAVSNLEKMKKEYADMLEIKAKEEARIRIEEENKKKNKEDLETIKSKFDTAKNLENEAKQQRKALNFQYKEKLSELHHFEMCKDKEKKVERKLIKEIMIQEKKITEITQIIGGLQELYDSKKKDSEIIQAELDKQTAKAENLQNQMKEVNQKIQKIKIEKEETEKLKDVIVSGMTQLENEISNEKKNAQKDRSFIDKLKRDRDVYEREIERTENTNKKLEEDFKNIEKLLKEKQNEIFGQKKEVERLNKVIMGLEKEKDSYAFQATSAEAKHFYSRDEVKLRDNFIAQFQKQHLQTEAKLKKQQALYEAVRADRNLVKKRLTSIKQENEDYKKRYKMVNRQIIQRNEEIASKELELIDEHAEHKKKNKKIEEEAKKIEKFERQIKEKDEKIKNYINDVQKLYAIIKQNESEKQKLQEEYELVVSERDILGTQLIRRSAQADLLYEKIKINQSTLAKGEDQYKERLDQISKKKNMIAELINEIKSFKNQTNSIPDLKNEIHTLNRELTENKLKVKALSQQLENPMNVHRWRKLEATDSLAYELMTKIQSIQRRLISKNDDVKTKVKQIGEKDKQLKQLQQILKRQPSIQEEKMIPIYDDTLKQKHEQTKAMEEEIRQHTEALEMDEIQMNNLKKKVDQFKKKIYFQKKREAQTKEDQNKDKQAVIHVHLPEKRFTGGGFNLSI